MELLKHLLECFQELLGVIFCSIAIRRRLTHVGGGTHAWVGLAESSTSSVHSSAGYGCGCNLLAIQRLGCLQAGRPRQRRDLWDSYQQAIVGGKQRRTKCIEVLHAHATVERIQGGLSGEGGEKRKRGC